MCACFPYALSDTFDLKKVFLLLEDLAEWKILGLHLGVPNPVLKEIQYDKPSVTACKVAVLWKWLNSGGATRQSLVSALRKMGENRLADGVLTGSVAATDLPPLDIATHTLTEETLGEMRKEILQVELCCCLVIKDNISSLM